MVDKKKQRDRIKKEFIDAAKQIIETEGVEQVSARKVGEISGYSYATIYNYFSDINMLLVETSLEYLEDCYRYMLEQLDETKPLIDQIVQLSKSYFLYLVENKDIFHIVFVQDFGTHVQEVAKDYVPKVALLLRDTLAKLDDKVFLLDKETTGNILSTSLHGRILFQINDRGIDNIETSLSYIEREIRGLLGGTI